MKMQSIFCGAKSEEKLVKASRDMYDCVYIFVSSINTAFRMLNQFLGSKLAIITVQENLSIKENLQLLQSALKEMQMLVELKDKDFQQKIEVPLYSQLILPTLSTDEKIRLVKDIYSQYNGVFESICGPICAVIIKHGNLPEMLEVAIQNLMSTPVLSLQKISDCSMCIPIYSANTGICIWFGFCSKFPLITLKLFFLINSLEMALSSFSNSSLCYFFSSSA
uniref:Uncharacterized protein n=1 Tax=Laticauda laticaudata TaxID=8630 RepID=A0A8C5RKK2_LATLA